MTKKQPDCNILFTIPALEGWLGISKPTVYNLIEMGLPCQKLKGQWVFHKGNVDSWFAKQTINAKPKDPTEAE